MIIVTNILDNSNKYHVTGVAGELDRVVLIFVRSGEEIGSGWQHHFFRELSEPDIGHRGNDKT